MIKLVVTDMDNTLYSWIDYIVPSVEAMVGSVAGVTKADVDRSRDLAGRHKRLSSRDCLHLAVMRRIGCERIWSFDKGFDRISGVTRIS